MTYTEFQDYFYSYYNSLNEYYNPKHTQKTVESFIAPTEVTFQILWDDYVNLFGESFIRSTFPQFEFDKTAVEYFNFILRNYAIDYQENDVKEFKIVCCSVSTGKTLWERPLNTNDLGSLYNYFTNMLLVDNVFYQNDHIYTVKIDAILTN